MRIGSRIGIAVAPVAIGLLTLSSAVRAAPAAPAARPAQATPAAPAAPPAPAGAAVDTGSAPSMDQLIDLLNQQKYQDLLKGVTKALALRGAASQPYNRADLLMLRGEAYLHLKQNSQAADSFAQAAKAASDDPDKSAIAQATDLLIKRSKPTGYLPRTASTQPAVKQGTPLPIIDKEERKIAFAALLDDELTAAAPKVKAATNGNSLMPVIEAARVMIDLRSIEIAAGEGDAKTKSIAERLGQRAHTLIDGALKSMNTRVEQVWSSASTSYSTQSQTTLRTRVYGMKGMTSVESGDLKNVIATCEKIVPVANDLSTVTGGTELSGDATEAQRLLKRAHEVLEYDYNNEGRDPRKSQEPRKSS
jgi:hypothetical protein